MNLLRLDAVCAAFASSGTILEREKKTLNTFVIFDHSEFFFFFFASLLVKLRKKDHIFLSEKSCSFFQYAFEERGPPRFLSLEMVYC